MGGFAKRFEDKNSDFTANRKKKFRIKRLEILRSQFRDCSKTNIGGRNNTKVCYWFSVV